ncbi:MAG: hypothetical protein ABGY75_07835 [Gemmataceae bacterium]
MPRLTFVALAVLAVAAARAADPPLVEKYLHSGELAKGEQVLERALDADPKDDQARFGLGVLRFVRAVERLCQSLYEYGVKSDSTSTPFLRLPVPKNPDPVPVTYPALRRVFERFTADLEKAESTLAGVTDDKVKLPLRLANIHLDLDGDGKPTDQFLGLLKKLLGVQRFEFLEKNPDFRVSFDRGDVAWLRAYCHLLSAMLDVYLACDLKSVFDAHGADHFANPRTNLKGDRSWMNWLTRIDIPEPARLGSFRTHMVKVCELNRETWRFVRAETDDDFEWLPNPKQKGVIGLPVRDEMIDGWLKAIDELEGLFTGKKLIDLRGLVNTDGKGLNVKELLDHPPEKLELMKVAANGVDAKYLSKLTADNTFDDAAFRRVMTVFGDSLSVAYAAWFN